MSCVHAYPPRYERHGLLGLHHFLLFPYGLGWCVGKSPCSPNLLGFYSYCFLFLPYMWLASCHFCHVGPLALLPFYLGFPCPFALLLPLVVPMGLLAIIPTMLAHWAYYLLPWASPTHLLYIYLFLCLWAWWLSFLPCWPIGLITSSLGFPWPICFTFTSCCAYGPTSCHSCHVGPLGLLPPSLGFIGPFTLLLPLLFLFSSIIPHCWASSTVVPFLSKMGNNT